MSQRLIDDNGVMDFVDDNAISCFIDDLGNFTCEKGNNVHTLTFLSTWGSGQRVQAWFDVKADKSGIVVRGQGFDDNSPVSETEIVQVLANGQFKSLAKCQADTCSVDWPTTGMSPGNNEIMFFMTSAAGRYGATTRVSKPQP